MDVKKEFLKIMSEQKEIALATSVNNIPNVRIVNFIYDSTNNILYFSSFKGNDKIKEMESNSHIAFTTIPHSGNEHVKAKGLVQKSTKTIFEVADQFIAKVPGYKNTIEFTPPPRSSRTWKRAGPWTACCAATWAWARPKWPCAP